MLNLLWPIAQSQNHERLRINVIQKDEARGELFPATVSMDKVETQYGVIMEFEVEKLATILPIFGKYTPEAITTILDTENKAIINELQSKAPSLWDLVRLPIKHRIVKNTLKSYPLHRIFALQSTGVFATSYQLLWPFYSSPPVQRDTFTVLSITLAGQNRASPPFGP